MSTATPPVTAVVRRRIKPGFESAFEALMQEFVPYVLRQPGHLGINVVRTSSSSRDYTVFDRFATAEDRRRFTSSPEYEGWMERLRTVSEAGPQVEEIEGLAFWFTLPNEPGHQAPPKLKMAMLTLLGVYPLSMLFPAILVPLTPYWPPLLRGLLIASLIVVSLTWFVMPNLTRLFKKWLFPSNQGD